MPEAAPRLSAGTLFIIEAVFGDTKSPEAMPMRNNVKPKPGYTKFTGSTMSNPKLRAVSTIPPVANSLRHIGPIDDRR
jgi:hypothetical protein